MDIKILIFLIIACFCILLCSVKLYGLRRSGQIEFNSKKFTRSFSVEIGKKILSPIKSSSAKLRVAHLSGDKSQAISVKQQAKYDKAVTQETPVLDYAELNDDDEGDASLFTSSIGCDATGDQNSEESSQVPDIVVKPVKFDKDRSENVSSSRPHLFGESRGAAKIHVDTESLESSKLPELLTPVELPPVVRTIKAEPFSPVRSRTILPPINRSENKAITKPTFQKESLVNKKDGDYDDFKRFDQSPPAISVRNNAPSKIEEKGLDYQQRASPSVRPPLSTTSFEQHKNESLLPKVDVRSQATERIESSSINFECLDDVASLRSKDPIEEFERLLQDAQNEDNDEDDIYSFKNDSLNQERESDDDDTYDENKEDDDTFDEAKIELFDADSEEAEDDDIENNVKSTT